MNLATPQSQSGRDASRFRWLFVYSRPTAKRMYAVILLSATCSERAQSRSVPAPADFSGQSFQLCRQQTRLMRQLGPVCRRAQQRTVRQHTPRKVRAGNPLQRRRRRFGNKHRPASLRLLFLKSQSCLGLSYCAVFWLASHFKKSCSIGLSLARIRWRMVWPVARWQSSSAMFLM